MSRREAICQYICSTRREVGMKTGLMQLRLQPEEKRSFQEAADLAGIPLSAWARERLRRAARIELVDANKPVPFLQAKVRAPQ